MSIKKTLPGFLLTIEDNMSPTVETPAVKDVYVIYGVLPDTMKYEDQDGNIYDKFIEPNKPLLIASGGREDAMLTLELSDIEITREVRNMLALMPESSTIALCRIVKRDGDNPDVKELSEMYEALDFAFESTENYPMKEIYCAGISLDKSVSLTPNEFKVIYKESLNDEIFVSSEFIPMFPNITNYEGSNSVVENKNIEVSFEARRNSSSMAEEKGLYNIFEFKVNGDTAMIEVDGVSVPFRVEYLTPTFDEATGEMVHGPASLPEGSGVNASIISGGNETLSLSVTGNINIIIDEDCVLKFTGGTITMNEDGQGEINQPLIKEIKLSVKKTSSGADILGRILKHNSIITATQNNCLTFMSPEPPRNASTKAISEYVDRVESLYEKVRERCMAVNATNGKKTDLGMFLSVPVGVNRLDTVGGVSGFPQSTLAVIEENKVITQKLTSSFAIGDIVEVYSHNKLDIEMITTIVDNVTISSTGTTELTLRDVVTDNVINTRTPKYIMNVNNKDFNGSYMAIQYSNICGIVGVNRSPAGVAWAGECQVMFSETQKNRLNSCKFATLMQKHGTVQGEVDKSQLMTSTTSQFQDFENIAVIYELVKGAKEIGMSYRGKRINNTTDLALIKTEIQGQVFDPAVGRFIESGYELNLVTKMLQSPNGKKEKALFVNFAVTEIQTMKLLRMTARLS
ncbi:MAG: hypothetical protein ACRC0G_03165 [Fusobacteriaceae bacterium]